MLEVPQPEAAALDVEHVSVVQQPVENGRGQGFGGIVNEKFRDYCLDDA
jgi:hypothetical protein